MPFVHMTVVCALSCSHVARGQLQLRALPDGWLGPTSLGLGPAA